MTNDKKNGNEKLFPERERKAIRLFDLFAAFLLSSFDILLNLSLFPNKIGFCAKLQD